MSPSWIWTFAGAAALLWALAMPIRVGIELDARTDRVWAAAIFHIAGPIRGRFEIPSLRRFRRPFGGGGKPAPGEMPHPAGGLPNVAGGSAVTLLKLALAVLRRVERLEWETRVGTGDAAMTSVCVGWLWAAKSVAIAYLSRHFTWLSPPRLEVVPDFDRPTFRVAVTCIFRFSIGEIIIGACAFWLNRWRYEGVKS